MKKHKCIFCNKRAEILFPIENIRCCMEHYGSAVYVTTDINILKLVKSKTVKPNLLNQFQFND